MSSKLPPDPEPDEREPRMSSTPPVEAPPVAEDAPPVAEDAPPVAEADAEAPDAEAPDAEAPDAEAPDAEAPDAEDAPPDEAPDAEDAPPVAEAPDANPAFDGVLIIPSSIRTDSLPPVKSIFLFVESSEI